MHCNFSISHIEQIFYKAGSVVLQVGAGYLSGHGINELFQRLYPGKIILGQPPILAIHPIHAGICAGVFALVDLVAKTIIDNSDYKDICQKPLYQLFRLIFTVTLSSLVASAILGITFKIAAAAILSSLIGSTILLALAKGFSNLNYAPCAQAVT
jgi:hypothetical protein